MGNVEFPGIKGGTQTRSTTTAPVQTGKRKNISQWQKAQVVI
jgi:hypothetical protein